MDDGANDRGPVRIKGGIRPGDPVHAKSNDGSINFINIVGIDIGSAQSQSMQEIDLVVDINFEKHEFHEKNYHLSLRQAELILELENANIVPGSKYEYILEQGSFQQNGTMKETQSKIKKNGHEVSLEGTASTQNILTNMPLIKGFINWKNSNQTAKNNDKEENTQIKNRIFLVNPGGQNSWNIGGEHGDPRLETKDLRGIIVRGFNDDKCKPLCQLKATSPSDPVFGRIRIRISCNSFVINQIDQQKIDKKCIKEEIFKKTDENQKKIIQDCIKKEKELRKNVAILAMNKKILTLNYDKMPGKIDITCRSFIAIPDLEP